LQKCDPVSFILGCVHQLPLFVVGVAGVVQFEDLGRFVSLAMGQNIFDQKIGNQGCDGHKRHTSAKVLNRRLNKYKSKKNIGKQSNKKMSHHDACELSALSRGAEQQSDAPPFIEIAPVAALAEARCAIVEAGGVAVGIVETTKRDLHSETRNNLKKKIYIHS
jgi:hypothetical protein